MEHVQKYYYHWVPKGDEITIQNPSSKKKANQEPWVIGIIDSSGSMSSWWEHVAKNYNDLIDSLSTKKVITFCFSSKIHPVPTNRLSNSIHDYEANMTNIVAAMEHLQVEIAKIPDNEEIKVVFVSDGHDTINGGNLQAKLGSLMGAMQKKVSFMCIGVQSNFPTFVSLFLREKYHRGDGNIPSIFLIEYASDKAFFNKFQSLREYFKVKAGIRIDPPQKLFPWEDFAEEVPEETWIMSKNPMIVLNSTTKVNYNPQSFSVDAVAEIFKAWSQKLQIDTVNKVLTGPQSQEFAESCFALMSDILNDIKITKGLDLINIVPSEKEDFQSTVLNHQIKLTKERVKGYLSSVQEIKNGKDLTKLNDFEAAKIISLGTVVGKRQQRVLALNNMNKASLDQMIKNFEHVLGTITLQDINKSTLQKAYTTGINLRILLGDSTLVSGLQKIPSAIDLAEIFPFVGLPVNLKWNDGFLDDAWKVDVKAYFTEFGPVDSRTFDFLTHKTSLPSANGEVEINSLIPLLTKEDAYLAKILDTELFRYLISYMATTQFDMIHKDSYPILLGDLYALALKNKDEKTAESVLDTVHAMKDFGIFKEIISKIESNDEAFCELLKRNSTFLLFFSYYCQMTEDIDQEEKEEYCQKIWLSYFQNRMEGKGVEVFISGTQELSIKEAIDHKYDGKFLLRNFYTSKEVLRHVSKNIIKDIADASIKTTKGGFQLIDSAFTADTNDLISFETTKTLTKKITGKEIQNNEIFNYIAHTSQHGAKGTIHPVEEDNEKVMLLLSQKLAQSSTNENLGKRLKFFFMDKLQKRYFDEFKKAHWGIKPIDWEEIAEFCQQKGIAETKINYNTARKLATNVCQSRDCPHFLTPNPKRLRNHLGGWQAQLPQGFHLFVFENKQKSDLDIYNGFISSRQISDIAKYDTTKEKIIEYIKLVRSAF